MKKTTPVQEVLESAALWKHAGAEISGGFITTVEIIRRGEKDFARVCFEAGQRYGSDLTLSIDDGIPPLKPDFDEWFKQFES